MYSSAGYLAGQPIGDVAKKAENRRRNRRLNELLEKPLEPKEFCARWVRSVAPEDRGYYSACVRELARVTEYSERTIQGWGPDFAKRPKIVVILLRKEDLIRQMREKLNEFDDLHE